MSLRLRAAFTAPSATTPDQDVHFHAGSGGRIFACDIDRCESASLTVGEVARLPR
jgi:hypothetical protein